MHTIYIPIYIAIKDVMVPDAPPSFPQPSHIEHNDAVVYCANPMKIINGCIIQQGGWGWKLFIFIIWSEKISRLGEEMK